MIQFKKIYLHSITAKTSHFMLCAGCDRTWLQPLSRVRDKRLAMQPKEMIMDFATKELTHGQTNALVKNLMDQMGVSDPVEAIRRINAGEWVVTQVKLPAFSTWKTVTVGNLSNAMTACKWLEDGGINIGNWGDAILGRATFEDAEATLDLVRVSVKELGLKDGAITAEIYAAAERHGLSLCPAEVAPQLWLQYPDLLSRGEWSLVAMETIVDSHGDRGVFYLDHNGDGRWLDASYGRPGKGWLANSRWVFVRSK